jgi:hypothetical protein
MSAVELNTENLTPILDILQFRLPPFPTLCPCLSPALTLRAFVPAFKKVSPSIYIQKVNILTLKLSVCKHLSTENTFQNSILFPPDPPPFLS